MRDQNGRIATESERFILDIVHRNPGISRSALTRHTEWKQQHVYRMVDTLVSRDLLNIGTPQNKSGPGKPSPQLKVNRDGGYAIGISINTDVISLSLANLGCDLIDIIAVETDPTDRDQAIRDIAKAATELRRKHDVKDDNLVGFGVALTGFRIGRSDVFQCPEPLKEWRGIPLSDLLMKGLSYPVWIENNANAGAIAESLIGAGQHHSSFAYLSFNYGFGSGIIVDGKPLAGAHGNAGEISSMFTYEELARRPALEGLLRRIKDGGSQITTIRELQSNFNPEMPGVREWIDDVTPLLELAIRALSGVADPSVIVFGGEAPRGLQDLLIENCDPFGSRPENLVQPARPELLNSFVDGDPATFGAALLPIKQSVLL